MCTNRLRGPLRTLSLAGLLLGLAPASQAFTLVEGLRKVSVGGPPFADGPSHTSPGPRYSVSDDGLFIVFTSTATNLLSGQADLNGASDVFLFDSAQQVIKLVSHVPGDPLTAADAESDQPVISPDGKFVVFRSRARNILPEGAGGFTGQSNVFLWEVQADTHTLVSRDSGSATTAGNDDSQNGVISRGAGRPFVAFDSLATNLLPSGTDKNGVSDVFRFNDSTGLVNIVSIPNPPEVESNGGSTNPVIDGSGNCVVYQSLATNLVSDQPADDTNLAEDVFRWKSPGGDPPTILLSHQAGVPNAGRGALTGSGPSTEPSVDDGCTVFAFKSTAKDLSPSQADGNGVDDVFHERDGGDAVLASHRDTFPMEAGDGASVAPILSRDGNWIAYASMATNLSPGQIDTAGSSDVFVYDIAKEESTLASHVAGDPKTAASGPSFAPEISTKGGYVAFTSDAKDIDPNQNDGNGARDILLYNRLWNNAVVASRRFASIAITGNRRSDVPALSGNGYTVAFTSESRDLIADDPETGTLEDVFFFRSLGLWPFVSVRSTENQNSLEWITPATNYVSMEVKVTATTPCEFMEHSDPGWTLLGAPVEPANSSLPVPFTDPSPLATTRCYGIFVQRDDDTSGIPANANPAAAIEARTLEAAAGPAKWASNVAGVTALGQVGIGAGNLIAVANDGGVYGIGRGPTGGLWSSGYWPFRPYFPSPPIQGRPGVLTLSVMGTTHTTFVGSQDGRVYALDADRGARYGGALWYTTPALGPAVQSGVAGMFTFFGGIGNHLLVGTRPSPGAAEFFALDPATGLRAGSPFSGAGFIGAINTTASVDYARAQVYFASHEFDAIRPSLWCLKLTAGGLGSTCWAAPQTLPSSISGGPIERNGTVYVGDDIGQVFAFSATAGTSNWAVPYIGCGGGGAVKSFVLADRLGTAQDLYYATTATSPSQLCAVTDLGGSPSTKWIIDTIPGPSAPLLVRIGGIAYLYVGSTDGSLYQIEADNETAIQPVLLRPGSTIGAPAFDFRDNMIYVGSTAGAIYAVEVPLP